MIRGGAPRTPAKDWDMPDKENGKKGLATLLDKEQMQANLQAVKDKVNAALAGLKSGSIQTGYKP